MNKIRERLQKVFLENQLEIEVNFGSQTTNFLDVSMHLSTGEHEPYRKEDALLRYINKGSNHPPIIRKRVPYSRRKSVCRLCSSEEEFDQHKDFYVYKESLRRSGYDTNL